MEISSFIDIASTPQVVFSWLDRPEKATVWMTSVSKTEIEHETPERVGTTFRETVEEGGGALEMQGVITGFVANKSIAFHLASRVHTVDVQYSIAETGAGVRLSEQARIRWKFPLNMYSLLFGKKMKQQITAQLQDEFHKLKDLCEGNVSLGKDS